jgi:hypothetical protein
MPPIPADQREPLIWAYNSQVVKREAQYTNELYAYCHRAALGLGDPGARAKMMPARSSSGPDGFHILVLLSQPIRAICTENGSMVLFSAAILREYGDGRVEGWLVSSHEAAMRDWTENYPEASTP